MAATPDPFVQTIVDVVVPRTVFGRVCLLGDAAFVVRPHTAGATAKAARDATVPYSEPLEAYVIPDPERIKMPLVIWLSRKLTPLTMVESRK